LLPDAAADGNGEASRGETRERREDAGVNDGQGALYVVATPIGNLDDLSPRARRVLAEVALILAEDTRHSARLLEHYAIGTPMRAFHEHNEARLCPVIATRIEGGERIALISDAGTPLFSDPGYRLLRTLRERGLRAVPIPGANAAVAALSVAGLATDRVAFEGFLPARGGARRARLAELEGESRTLVFYEAPHRIVATVEDLYATLGDTREATLARELTKIHEQLIGGTLGELRVWLREHPQRIRGEFVIVVAGHEQGAPAAEQGEAVLRTLLEELRPPQAAKLAARITGARRNALYRRALELDDEKE